jgi:transposase
VLCLSRDFTIRRRPDSFVEPGFSPALLIGHALGGLPGQRSISRLNMPTSNETILRRLKHLPREPVTSEVRVIGVDEWAWSKGQSFGTILVGLEQGRVVDVLAESSADGLASWLFAHPGFAIMRKLTIGFRAILSRGKVAKRRKDLRGEPYPTLT